MNPRVGWSIIAVLAVLILVLAVLLFAGPAPAPGKNDATPPPPVSQPFTSENVNVSFPLPNAIVPKSFTVVGQARGTWYFEASFPVQVRDPDSNLLVSVPAQAQGDWMTTGLVPFTAQLTVTGYTGPATLVLLKDNPSGLPENEDAVEFPIVVQ